MEAWAAASFTHETIDGTKQLNSEALGKVQMLAWVIDALEIKE